MSTPTRLVVLLAVLGLTVPATASAAPRAATPAPAAHQDGSVDDVPDAAEEFVDDGLEELDADEWGDDDPEAGKEDWAQEDWTQEDEPEAPPVIEYATGRTVRGSVAMLRRDGKAALPRSAPKRVKRVIAAANRIVGKPYKWGGGHARLQDRGYDCSGTVSYALIRAGLLDAPLVSGGFAKWGAGGAGKWITIYANKGHVYMEVAGLRLDTSPMGDSSGKGPRWRPAIGKRPGFKVRRIAGL